MLWEVCWCYFESTRDHFLKRGFVPSSLFVQSLRHVNFQLLVTQRTPPLRSFRDTAIESYMLGQPDQRDEKIGDDLLHLLKFRPP